MIMQVSTIEEALASIRNGSFALVVDDFDRENEGDFIGAATTATPASVAMMLRHCTGVVCAPLTHAAAARLDLPLMVPTNNMDPFRTAFTVTVDARSGTSTGISATDRATTIRALCDESAVAGDFSRPGHVFPLLAREGGVLSRSGHTEAGVDLCRLAGLPPVAYLCEVCDHTTFEMTRFPGLVELAKQLALPLISIADLQRYRYRTEVLVQQQGDATQLLGEAALGGCQASSSCTEGQAGEGPLLRGSQHPPVPPTQKQCVLFAATFRSLLGPNEYHVALTGTLQPDPPSATSQQQGVEVVQLLVTFESSRSTAESDCKAGSSAASSASHSLVHAAAAAVVAAPGHGAPTLHIRVMGDFSSHIEKGAPSSLLSPVSASSSVAEAGDAEQARAPRSAYAHLFPLPAGVCLPGSAAAAVCDRVSAELSQVIAAAVSRGRLPARPMLPAAAAESHEGGAAIVSTGDRVRLAEPAWPRVTLVAGDPAHPQPLPRYWEYGVAVVAGVGASV